MEEQEHRGNGCAGLPEQSPGEETRRGVCTLGHYGSDNDLDLPSKGIGKLLHHFKLSGGTM